MRRKIVAANWKMNLLPDEAEALFSAMTSEKKWSPDVEVIVFPPAIYLQNFAQTPPMNLSLGIQNFYPKDSGAFTGEIGVKQAKEIGSKYALIGHSERRMIFGEDFEFLKDKVNSALQTEIIPIFCCGEPLEIRAENKELDFVKNQLEKSLFHLVETQILKVIIAYEPVWAIGTGKTASSQQAEEMHGNIRLWISEKYGEEIANIIPILYGGSCSPENAAELFACANVDGGLIGGASLKLESFTSIINQF